MVNAAIFQGTILYKDPLLPVPVDGNCPWYNRLIWYLFVTCDMIKGKCVTCQKFLFSYTTLSELRIASLMQTLSQLGILSQSYDGFVNAKNNIKQSNLNTVFANISKTTSATSDSFLLIMSHIHNLIKGYNWIVSFVPSFYEPIRPSSDAQ